MFICLPVFLVRFHGIMLPFFEILDEIFFDLFESVHDILGVFELLIGDLRLPALLLVLVGKRALVIGLGR